MMTHSVHAITIIICTSAVRVVLSYTMSVFVSTNGLVKTVASKFKKGKKEKNNYRPALIHLATR